MDSYTKYIKKALVITTQDLKKKKSALKKIGGFCSISKRNTYKIIKIFKKIIQQTK